MVVVDPAPVYTAESSSYDAVLVFVMVPPRTFNVPLIFLIPLPLATISPETTVTWPLLFSIPINGFDPSVASMVPWPVTVSVPLFSKSIE